jgi:hypothetical protein
MQKFRSGSQIVSELLNIGNQSSKFIIIIIIIIIKEK